MNESMQACPRCGKELVFRTFFTDDEAGDGHYAVHQCNACGAVMDREWRPGPVPGALEGFFT